jgi:hypothetical protein
MSLSPRRAAGIHDTPADPSLRAGPAQLFRSPHGQAESKRFEFLKCSEPRASKSALRRPSQWRGIKFAGFRHTTLKITGYEAVADSTDTVIPRGSMVYDTEPFWSAVNPKGLTIPASFSKVRLKSNLDWTFGGSGYRHI